MDPLHDDTVLTRPMTIRLKLTPDEIEVLDVTCTVLQMTRDQYVTRLVRQMLK